MSKQDLHAKPDAIFNAYFQAERARDLDETLATMSPDLHLVQPYHQDGPYPAGD